MSEAVERAKNRIGITARRSFALLTALIMLITLSPCAALATDTTQLVETVPLCTCADKCSEGHANAECAVCAADYTLCAGVAQIKTAQPLYELARRELHYTAADGASVSVAGLLPAEAELSVEAVPLEQAAELIASELRVVFAYDIKIMINGAEYQPAVPVAVSIKPPSEVALAETVSVTHIDGENNAETIAEVAPTAEGAVEFEAESFSVYIGTEAVTEITVYPAVMYWNGGGFFADEACSAGQEIVDSQGAPFTRLPALLTALGGDTTVYMKAAYSADGTAAAPEEIGCAAHSVTLKRHSAYPSGAIIDVASDKGLTLSNITIDGGAVWTGAADATLGRGTTNSGVSAQCAAVSVTSGSLTIESGYIIQNNDNQSIKLNQLGGGLHAGTNAALTITGGVFTSNHCANGGCLFSTKDSSVTISGGTVSRNSTKYGGGFVIEGGASISGVEISNNTATSYAGGIHTCGTAKHVSVIDCRIINNTCNLYGGGIYVNTTLTVSGGVISGNTAGDSGNGIKYQSVELRLTGSPQIDDELWMKSTNILTVVDGDGTTTAAFEPVNPIPLNIPGLATGSEAVKYFSDTECADPTPATASDFSLTNVGYQLVQGASADRLVVAERLYASVSGAFFVGNTLTAALEREGVTANSYKWQRYDDSTAVWNDISGATDSSYIALTADIGQKLRVVIKGSDALEHPSSGQTVLVRDLYWNGANFFTDETCTEVNKVKSTEGAAYATLPALLADITQSAEPLTIYMKAGYTVSGTQTVSCTTRTVTLMRHSDYSNYLINIPYGASLTLTDITVDGGAVWTGDIDAVPGRGTTNNGVQANTAAVSVDGALTLESGAVVQNNDNRATQGGGVIVNAANAANLNSQLNISGGSVCNNRSFSASKSGGGVYCYASATVSFTSGSICGNCTDETGTLGGGGGMVVWGILNMTGGTISGNKAAHGGGINGINDICINGGVIENNRAELNGGGLIIAGLRNEISGGVIRNNAAANGGGIAAYGEDYSVSLVISGGLITGNTAASHGGGVRSSSGATDEEKDKTATLTVTGGLIIGNTATTGADVNIHSRAQFCAAAVTGGSVQSIVSSQAEGGTTSITDGANAVTCHTVTLVDSDPASLRPVYANAAVTALGLSTGSYGINDVKTDGSGKLYFWLPEDRIVNSVTTFENGIYTTHGLNPETVHANISYTSLEVNVIKLSRAGEQTARYPTKVSNCPFS